MIENDNVEFDHKNNKKPMKTPIKLILLIGIFVISSLLLYFFAISWQKRNDLLGITNAFYFAAIIYLAISFLVFAANNNVFSPFIYGIKSFGLLLTGKKAKNNYYEYTKDIEENPIPKILVFYPLLCALPHLITAITLHIIYNGTL